MGEKHERHQREYPAERAGQQAEVGPTQLKRAFPACATDGGPPRFLTSETVCSHMAPPRYFIEM